MATNWEKPGFEVMTVGAECTAYSGSQAAMQRPSPETGLAVVSGESMSECKAPVSNQAAPGKSDPRLG
jgi:hypothetical protein